MTQTVFYDACTALIDLLEDEPAVAVDQIVRGRRTPMPEGVDSRVTIRPADADEMPISVHEAPIDRMLIVAINLDVRDTDAEAELDVLLKAVYAKLMTDSTLGGVAIDITPGRITWDFDSLDDDVASAALLFNVRLRTPHNSLED